MVCSRYRGKSSRYRDEPTAAGFKGLLQTTIVGRFNAADFKDLFQTIIVGRLKDGVFIRYDMTETDELLTLFLTVKITSRKMLLTEVSLVINKIKINKS